MDNLATSVSALFRNSVAGLRALLVLTVLLGLAYPLVVTGVAQVAFPWRANGSMVTETGEHVTDPSKAVGSTLIGQQFKGARWFAPRPSAAGDGYDTTASAGSNLGPNSTVLAKEVRKRKAEVMKTDDATSVPPDAVTASGSGLDPDISPAYAELQVPRVARENDLSEAQVRRLVEQCTTGRTLGILGEPRVNVLALNTALQKLRG